MMVVVDKEGKSAATPSVVIKLGQAIKLVSGAPFKSELFNEVGEGLPLIRVRDVNTGPAGVFYSGDFLQEHLINTGDLLVSMDGDFKAIRWAHGTGLLNQRVCKITPDEDVLNGRYLEKFLPKALAEIHRETTFTTVKHLSTKVIREIEIPLPPLDDQVRIAHLLGKVEVLLAERKQHLQKLDDLLKSMFLGMFGDPILNPHGFPVRKLSEFYVNPKEGTKCGPFGSALKKEELVNGGVPVWNMDNITSNGRMELPFRMWITADKYEELTAYSVKDGDVIISRAGTVGKMCVARMNEQPAIISTNLIRVRLGNELRPLHFVSLMLYCKGRVGRLKTGADGAFTHMNTGVLDSLEFPYPSIELQDQFAAVVEKVEAIKSCHQQSLTDLEAFHGALSQQAFKGELDLSRVALPAARFDRESPVAAAVPVPITTPVIELPETDLLLPALQDRTQLTPLLRFWLEAYRTQFGRAAFSLERFIAAAQTRLAELHPDNDFEWTASDYESIKTWVFEALAAGALTQAFDDDGNCIELKAVAEQGVA